MLRPPVLSVGAAGALLERKASPGVKGNGGWLSKSPDSPAGKSCVIERGKETDIVRVREGREIGERWRVRRGTGRVKLSEVKYRPDLLFGLACP